MIQECTLPYGFKYFVRRSKVDHSDFSPTLFFITCSFFKFKRLFSFFRIIFFCNYREEEKIMKIITVICKCSFILQDASLWNIRDSSRPHYGLNAFSMVTVVNAMQRYTLFEEKSYVAQSINLFLRYFFLVMVFAFYIIILFL